MTARSSPPARPSAPTDVVAVAVNGCQVLLAWTESVSGALGFRIERAVCNSPCTSFVKIGGVGPHVTAFQDGSVKPRTIYSYRVLAWNASGDSAPSNVVEMTTMAAAAERPADQE